MNEKYDAELQWWKQDAAKRAAGMAQELQFKEWADYYSGHLDIPLDYNCGRLLDVGAGPILPARHLCYDELWCVDPLFVQYSDAGFQITGFNVVLLPFQCENLWGIPGDFFDTIISVNAMDHVDNFEQAAAEIERVAKPEALVRLRMEYHPPRVTEPMELNDRRVLAAFRRFHMMRLTDIAVFNQVLWSSRRELT